MNDTESRSDPPKTMEGWDTGSHQDFYEYYAKQSQSPATLQRFQAATEILLRAYGEAGGRLLEVLDVGCGAGAQSVFWTRAGHRYRGIDINEPLITLARERAAEQKVEAHFDVGTATALPCADASIDICLLPELLEHVAEWQACVDEAVRVMRPGGLLYINTSSKLCPIQQEFNLPLYSWYPASLKRYFEKRAVTDWPAVANHAKYPAVNWFSYFGLKAYLAPKGFTCMDRFDLADSATRGAMGRAAIAAIQASSAIRFVGHVMTPYTFLVARKSAGRP